MRSIFGVRGLVTAFTSIDLSMSGYAQAKQREAEMFGRECAQDNHDNQDKQDMVAGLCHGKQH